MLPSVLPRPLDPFCRVRASCLTESPFALRLGLKAWRLLMNDSRVVDAPKPSAREGGQFGSRRTNGLRPRESAPYRSTLPANLTGSHPEAKPAPTQTDTAPLRWPDHR